VELARALLHPTRRAFAIRALAERRAAAFGFRRSLAVEALLVGRTFLPLEVGRTFLVELRRALLVEARRPFPLVLRLEFAFFLARRRFLPDGEPGFERVDLGFELLEFLLQRHLVKAAGLGERLAREQSDRAPGTQGDRQRSSATQHESSFLMGIRVQR